MVILKNKDISKEDDKTIANEEMDEKVEKSDENVNKDCRTVGDCILTFLDNFNSLKMKFY